MSERSRILVVDDEPAIADLVVSVLEREGFESLACYNSLEALDIFRSEHFDLVILDVMMPSMDGFELCAKIRTISEVPVMFLSAKAEENDQVVGFSLGADDYISKPFQPRSLIARVRARLRRASTPPASPSTVIRCGSIIVDPHYHKASLLDEALDLTPTEFALLQALASHAGRPVSSKQLFEEIWNQPSDASSANTVMVHIRNLRRKLATVDNSKIYIENTWGVGYSLRDRP